MRLPVAPSLAEFRSLADRARVISVHAKLRLDDLTPVGVYDRLCEGREGTFLFESADARVWSRWSFIGVNSSGRLEARGDRAEWIGEPIAGITLIGDALEATAALLSGLATEPVGGLPPLTSGLVGYLAYDVVRHLERIPDANPDELGVPDAIWLLASDMAVVDHHRGEIWLIANAVNANGLAEGVEEAWADAAARVEAMAAKLGEPHATRLGVPDAAQTEPTVRRSMTDEQFCAVVEAAKEHVFAGDIFQVVPSQRFSVATTADPLDIYRELRVTNPSPYLFLLRLPGFSIVGASPEALVTVTDDVATAHPIAGTRPRSADPAVDHDLEVELLADEKERAEHLMLVDLGRNDLGRVCVPGTVSVTEFMRVRRYSHVMHIESTLTGRVRPGVTALDVTMACFPQGTLSGAPKVRAMEIIDELETVRRGPYGGVVGYFDFAGNSDAAITIRSAVVKDGWAHVQAGAGIVADSDPASENQECRNKAAAMIAAIRAAGSERGLDDPETSPGPARVEDGGGQ